MEVTPNPTEQAVDAREARNNALEEAARVCDERAAAWRENRMIARQHAAEHLAARIRALKSQEPSRLFAAAPALLEALERAVSSLPVAGDVDANGYTEVQYSTEEWDEMVAATKQACAAIAAAKGE